MKWDKKCVHWRFGGVYECCKSANTNTTRNLGVLENETSVWNLTFNINEINEIIEITLNFIQKRLQNLIVKIDPEPINIFNNFKHNNIDYQCYYINS